MSVVRPELGPTLPELLAPRWRALPRAVRRVLVALAAVLLAGGAAFAFTRGSDDTHVVVRQPLTFNFVFRDGLREVAPGGAIVRLASPPGAKAPLSFTASTLRLPPYRGTVFGILPTLATELTSDMARRYPEFAVRQEGRANINKFQGYEIVFQTRRDGQLTYGRRVILVPDEPAPRVAVDLVLLAARSPQVPRADAVGRSGPLKVALRSFRFGAQRP